MPAYVIIQLSINKPDEFKAYQQLSPGAVAAYGGKFIVRGGKSIPLEGDWNPERVVVLEFPSSEIAKNWWHSDEYAEAKAMRQRSAETKMFIVEGV